MTLSNMCYPSLCPCRLFHGYCKSTCRQNFVVGLEKDRKEREKNNGHNKALEIAAFDKACKVVIAYLRENPYKSAEEISWALGADYAWITDKDQRHRIAMRYPEFSNVTRTWLPNDVPAKHKVGNRNDRFYYIKEETNGNSVRT